ncbi:hypothetical protein P43SY_011308 [Pythium insidiosum]|uniref:Uncharacterized protein n=1 Tax=Pythium insidiosum TaxID=114742 RepID=A0AAD5LQJ2_PYTIN|nr:hypothetical protein P43SY_011308 [Pythium insidiosum]
MPSDTPHAPAGSLPDDMPVDPQSGDTRPESSGVAASGAGDGADGAQPTHRAESDPILERALVPFGARPWTFFAAHASRTTASWRDVVDRVGGDLTQGIFDAASTSGLGDAARERLALGRRLLDQRLTDLFNATAASVGLVLDTRAHPWVVPSAEVLSALLGGDDDTILHFGAPHDASVQPSAPDSLAEIADALRLVASLRAQFGVDRFSERLRATVLACGWLTHVVHSMVELLRLQDVERFVGQDPAPLDLLRSYDQAQRAARSRQSVRRSDALREALVQR